MSEEIASLPFSHLYKNNFLPIILDEKIYIFRAQSFKEKVTPLVEKVEDNDLLKFKKYFQRSKIKKLNFKSVQRLIYSENMKNYLSKYNLIMIKLNISSFLKLNT